VVNRRKIFNHTESPSMRKSGLNGAFIFQFTIAVQNDRFWIKPYTFMALNSTTGNTSLITDNRILPHFPLGKNTRQSILFLNI